MKIIKTYVIWTIFFYIVGCASAENEPLSTQNQLPYPAYFQLPPPSNQQQNTPVSNVTDVIIFFNGLINQKKASMMLSYIQNKFISGVRNFTIYINSGGGDTDSSIAVYQALSALPITITTINSGSVQSGALWIYCSGSKRFALPGTYFMIHGSTINSQAIHSFVESRNLQKLYDILYNAEKDMLKSCSTISDKLIDEYTRSSDQIYFSTPEAKEVGIVHKIGDLYDHKDPKKGSYEFMEYYD